MDSPGVKKFDLLPDAMALILTALFPVWIIREHYGGLIAFSVVVLLWFVRARKGEPRMPNGPVGLTLALIGASSPAR
jgi:hypothetical protein